MKKLTCLALLLLSFSAYSQAYQEEVNFENEEDSFNYDSSDDDQLEHPNMPDVYDDTFANETNEEDYLNEEE